MKVALLLALTLAAAAPAMAGPPDFAPGWLAAHNRERAQLGMPALKWSDRLAAEAQGWADSLAQRGAFEHARNRGGAGENLWAGAAGYYDADAMIGAFLAEKHDFRPGRFPDISRSGSWQAVGHYSQIIWPATREVGCAIAEGRGREVLVCRYWPAGNIYGQAVP